MFFLYLKSTGQIVPPIHKGEPSNQALNKELNCELGSGIKWENVDLFFAPDEDFEELDDGSDFHKWATTGKYYIENNEIKENLDWEEPEEEEL